MRGRASAAWLLRLLVAAAACAAGCQVLIDGELGVVRCADEGAVGPPACPEGLSCAEGTCVEAPELGRPCDSDAACGPGALCLDPAAFGGAEGRVCARACCTSSDCGADGRLVCWVPDRGGGAFCRLGEALGRPAAGSRRPGEACADGADCRSGLCVAGACAGGCCSDASCAAAGGTCQLTSGLVSAGAAWACQPAAPQRKGYLALCAEDADCASGMCHLLGTTRRCVVPCCGSAMCPGSVNEPSGQGGVVYDVRCAEIDRGGVVVRACAALTPPGGAAVGAPCAADKDCRSHACVASPDGSARVCSDACCDDASCGDASVLACRPRWDGASWALRCELK